MRIFPAFLLVFLPFLAFSAEQDRLSDPPAVQATCNAAAGYAAFAPVSVGPIPSDKAQQKAFLAKAERENIHIGFEKFGPFDEDRGTFQVTCLAGEHTVKASFHYINYPTTESPDGSPLLAEGQCDAMTRLELSNLSVDGQTWGTWPSFLHHCKDESPKIESITVYPSRGFIRVCTSPNGSQQGSAPGCANLNPFH